MYDFRVLWTGKYYQSWENNAHSHGFFQMIAAAKGSGVIELGGQSYEFTEHEIFLIPPHVRHAVQQQSPAAMPLLLDVKFSVSDEDILSDLSQLPPCLRLSNFALFQSYFDCILRESELRRPYYYQCICHYFGLLMSVLLREGLGHTCSEAPLLTSDTAVGRYNCIDMDALLQYIQQNFASIISLEDLASIANISKTTLIQAFKTTLGTTPINYINAIRLAKSKELLVNTDSAIGEISELIGFQSLHYFSRYFKAQEGISPTEYRLRHSKSRFYSYRVPVADDSFEDFTKF